MQKEDASKGRKTLELKNKFKEWMKRKKRKEIKRKMQIKEGKEIRIGRRES